MSDKQSRGRKKRKRRRPRQEQHRGCDCGSSNEPVGQHLQTRTTTPSLAAPTEPADESDTTGRQQPLETTRVTLLPGEQKEGNKMKSWTDLFGKQTPRNLLSSPVRTRFSRKRDSSRGKLTIVFSPEVLEIMDWKGGELLDLQCDGTRLFIAPSPTGRKLHSSYRTIGLAIDDRHLSQAKDSFGFDVTQPQFWDKYNVDGEKLLLLLCDRGVASEAE